MTNEPVNEVETEVEEEVAVAKPRVHMGPGDSACTSCEG